MKIGLTKSQRKEWLTQFMTKPGDIVLLSIPGEEGLEFFSASLESFMLYSDRVVPLAVVRRDADDNVFLLERMQ